MSALRLGMTSGILLLGMVLMISCAPKDPSSSTRQSLPAATLREATYVPSPSLIGVPVSKGSVTLKQKTLSYTNIGMVRFNDPWSSKELLVDLGNYDQAVDFGGVNGSITLTAETVNYPLEGGAYPVLSEFFVVGSSGTTEFIKLTEGCRTQGMWQCSGGLCSARPSCGLRSGSSFGSRQDWDQHQVPPFGYVTTNLFPRCDAGVSGWACPSSGGLPTGHYYAKYLLLSNSGAAVSDRLANLNVTVTVKRDPSGRNAGITNGGVNLNLILVGDQNINDSHTANGARNLDLLFAELNRLFSLETGSKLGLNELKVYEWSDAEGGSQYSHVDADLLGNLFESGSRGVGAAENGNHINLFLVSDITYVGGAFTVLGLSGGILGPPLNGTQSSGLAFSSFDKLSKFNPNLSCTRGGCARVHQENDFLEMAATIAHELGHYMGLNHPSEKPDDKNQNSQDHDGLSDTPTCAYRMNTATTSILDQRSCYYTDTTLQQNPLGGKTCRQACDEITGNHSYLYDRESTAYIDPPLAGQSGPSGSLGVNGDMPDAFCPQVKECQYNHVMWYTTKNRKVVSGDWQEDGNLFSDQSSAVLQWNPFVR